MPRVRDCIVRANWHVLDAGSIWLKEFASALGRKVPVCNWCPSIHNLGWLQEWQVTEHIPDPGLSIIRFPMQRGYSRFPADRLLPYGQRVAEMLASNSGPAPRQCPLICTTPFYARVAERWPGPCFYYLTDLAAAYPNLNANKIKALDRRMCKVARAVFPCSRRIAAYLQEEAGCPGNKITVIPNATREQNLLVDPGFEPLELPRDLADLPRPIAGVIGNLAANMDWLFLREAVERTPTISWAFIGPTDMDVDDPQQRAARRELMRRGGRLRFTGPKPYGALRDYARAFDVAVIPYHKHEPNFSGTSTRFYEHLAAGRPMLATPAVDELLSKEPLLKLVHTAAQLALEKDRLRANGFRDGFEELRWSSSREATWEARADAIIAAVSAAQIEPGGSDHRVL